MDLVLPVTHLQVKSSVVTNRAEVSLEEVAAGEGDGPEEDGMKRARLEMAYGCTCLIKHLLGLASPGCQAGHLTLGSEGQAEHFLGGGSSSPLPHPARSLELAACSRKGLLHRRQLPLL